MQRTTGTARQLHLARAARIAGEAFAFAEVSEPRPASVRLPTAILGWSLLGLLAASALLVRF